MNDTFMVEVWHPNGMCHWFSSCGEMARIGVCWLDVVDWQGYRAMAWEFEDWFSRVMWH